MKKEFWNQMGDLYLKANAVDAAIDSYHKAIQQGYQNSDVYLNLAGAFMRKGLIVESIQVYQKGIDFLDTNQEKAIIYTKIGDCYRRLQDFDNAIAAFRSAIDLEPGNPRLIDGLMQVQQDLEKLYSLEEFDSLPINNELTIVNERETLKTSTPVEEIVTPLEAKDELENVRSDQISIVELDEEKCAEIMPPALFEDSSKQLSEGVDDNAQSDKLDTVPPFFFEELKANLDLEDCQTVFSMEQDTTFSARTLENVDEDDGADLPSNNKAIEAKSEIAPEKEEGVRVTMLLMLGLMYWRNENLEEAVRTLQSAIEGSEKINNTWLEALSWHSLALVKTAMADIMGAIESYSKAMRLAPDRIFPWNNVGALFSSLGNNDEAMNSFQKALKQNPENATSWNGLGDIFSRLGRLEDAIAAYQLGNLFDGRAKGSDAVKSYEKAFDFYHFTLASFDDQTHAVTENKISEEVEAQQTIEQSVSLDQTEETPEQIVSVTDIVTEAKNQEPEELLLVDDSSFESMLNESKLPVPLQTDFDIQEQNLEQEPARPQPETVETPMETTVAHTQELSSSQVKVRHLAPAYQARDRRSVPVVALYEDYVDEVNRFVETPKKQPENAEMIFSANPTILPSGMSGEGSRSIEDQSVGNVNEVISDKLIENVPDLSNEILQPGIGFVEADAKSMEELSSNPEIGMLPIVDVDPTPKPEVNRVAVTISTYEATVRENPYNDRAWDSLGNLYRIVHRNKDAIRAFERAVALEPTKYVYHYQLGTLYASEGNFSAAIREIQTVVDLNPDFTFAHCALASYLRRVGKDDEAQRHIAIAAPFMKNEKEYDRACFESIRGNVNAALELLEVALEKKQTTIEWIQRDLDLDFIRQDPRYHLMTSKSSQSVVGY